MILLDTGPLVAMLNRRDRHYQWITEQLNILRPPFSTCESVISEACFLLQQAHLEFRPIFDLIERKLILVQFNLQTEFAAVGSLMNKYSDIPMDLADACLVRMAEKEPAASVLTVDSDFLLYRKNTRKIIPTIIPDEIRDRSRRKSRKRSKATFK